MTISFPGSSRKGLGGLLGRKKKRELFEPTAKKQLGGEQVARLFDKRMRPAETKPAKLNETEQEASAQQSSLRGALYSSD
ncbi:MAG: hypothetical protein AAGF56_04070 [Pseudomonadota bacterium]